MNERMPGVPSAPRASVFRLVTECPVPAERMWHLSLNIDEHLGSMSHSNERAVAGVTSGQIGPGESVTWSARHFGIRFRMTSSITEWDAPRRFVDEQTRGPFRTFHHEHTFVDMPGACSTMVDEITYAAPFGFLGRLAERLVLTRYLRRLILRRNEYLLIAAGSAPIS